jgi:Spy/CpxP family protein refolding chaperone
VVKKAFFSRIVVALVFLMALGIVACSDCSNNGNCPDNHGKGNSMHSLRSIDSLQKELGLSEQQVKQIQSIRESYGEKYKAQKGNSGEFQKLLQQHWNEVLGVLTKEQKVKYTELHQKAMHHHGHSGECERHKH